MNVISAQVRPHLAGISGKSCWCRPEVREDESCIYVTHKILDVRPDVRARMAVFGDQSFWTSPPTVSVSFAP